MMVLLFTLFAITMVLIALDKQHAAIALFLVNLSLSGCWFLFHATSQLMIQL